MVVKVTLIFFYLLVLQFSLISIVTLIPHTHSFMYHRRYIILATDSIVK